MTEPKNEAEELRILAEAVPAVATSFDESEAAFAEESAAKAAVLAKAIELARPALRAICGRVRIEETTRWIDNAYTADEKVLSTWRGAFLLGNGPERDHPRANDGQITGQRLVLRDDGQLLVLTYSGTWTRWQGCGSGWEAAVAEITPRQCVDKFELPEVLAALAKAVTSHGTETRQRNAAAARARAARLLAILALVE